MHRLLLLALVLPGLIASSCAQRATSSGAASPRDADDVTSANAGDEAGARAAAISFLEAYASAPDDAAEALGGTVAPSGWIRRWAHWVGVQAEQFPGTQDGELLLRSIAPAETPEPGPPGARTVAVDASVRFRLAPADGEPFALTRVFTGFKVAWVRSVGWVVTDAIRDGVPLSASFVAFDPPLPEARAGGIVAVIDSLVSYPAWQFHLAVTASRDATLARAELVTPTGEVAAEAGTATEGVRSVDAREPAEGIVTFEPRSLEGEPDLRLVYVADGREHALTFDLDVTPGDASASA